jgi:NAD(P)-dependent dehydrogenase (short-subunit alcohol dehydrogenase family)
MSLKGKFALITGGSRGIGRGIALKLAEKGAVNYYRNEAVAKQTLEKLRGLKSDGFIIQADVCRPEEIARMFSRVKEEFGALDILVSNARPEVANFYQPPMELTLDRS